MTTNVFSSTTGTMLTDVQRADRYTAKALAVHLAGIDCVYFDTETTGIDTKAEVIEISAVTSAGHLILDTLIRPSAPVSNEIEAITHISNDMLKNAPSFNEVWSEISALLAGKHLVAYNAQFDVRMLMQNALAIGKTNFISFASIHCAMQLFSCFAATPGKRSGYKWYKLGEAADMMQVPVKTALHRALADATLTRDLVHAVAKTL